MSRKLKILICSPLVIDPKYGGAKAFIELAESLRERGNHCDLISPDDMDKSLRELSGIDWYRSFSVAQKDYLLRHAHKYDIVEYDHNYLPYERSLFPASTLMVARSVLLSLHLTNIKIQRRKGIRSWLGQFINGKKRKVENDFFIHSSLKTVQESDLTIVSSFDDKYRLMNSGIPHQKIFIAPFGLNKTRVKEIDPSRKCSQEKNIAFIGTFDMRKGANDFPKIVREVIKKHPEAKFKLLGTKGMFATEEDVKNYFYPSERANLEILPRFEPHELQKHLANSRLGIFPSYLEGLPFAVLEMSMNALPVIAYDAPGATMVLPPELIVPAGDIHAMSDLICAYLDSHEKCLEMGHRIQSYVSAFSWSAIAEAIEKEYLRMLELKGISKQKVLEAN